MTNNAGPLYEMNLVIADEVLADVEHWLEETVQVSLRQDNIESARVSSSARMTIPKVRRAALFSSRPAMTIHSMNYWMATFPTSMPRPQRNLVTR